MVTAKKSKKDEDKTIRQLITRKRRYERNEETTKKKSKTKTREVVHALVTRRNRYQRLNSTNTPNTTSISPDATVPNAHNITDNSTNFSQPRSWSDRVNISNSDGDDDGDGDEDDGDGDEDDGDGDEDDGDGDDDDSDGDDDDSDGDDGDGKEEDPTLDDILDMDIVDTRLLKKALSPIDNDCKKNESLSGSLSQLLSGNNKMKDEVQSQIKKYIEELRQKIKQKQGITEEQEYLLHIIKSNIFDKHEQILFVVSALFRCKVVLFTKINRNQYRILKTNKGDDFNFQYTIYLQRNEDFFSAMKIIRKPNGKEFKIEEILSHKSLMKLSNGATFCVKWAKYGREHNSMEPWNGLLQTRAFEEYIRNLETRIHGSNQAKKELGILKNEVAVKPNTKFGQNTYDPNHNRIRFGNRKAWTLGSKKKFTGRKMKVASDILNLKGKGGCYCLMPHEKIDDNSKALFKIGMTLDFTSRLEEYHTYFPEGLFHVAFLCDPLVQEWTEDKITEWKNKSIDASKKKKVPTRITRNDVVKAMKTQKYKEIEKYIFAYVSNNNGQRLHSTVNVRNPHPITKKGETEWFYTDDSLVHEAFSSAEEKYGGEKLLFSLSGLDPDTGEQIESINVHAEERIMTLPHYSGSITYQI